MEQGRLFIAIALSFLIFFVWNYFFVEKPAPPEETAPVEQAQSAPPVPTETQPYQAPAQQGGPAPEGFTTTATPPMAPTAPRITVNTPLYRAQISAQGALFKSFELKDFRETVDKEAPLKNVIPPENTIGFPQMSFAGPNLPGVKDAVFYADTDASEIDVSSQAQTLTYTWTSPNGIVVQRAYTFKPDTYLIGLSTRIKNGSQQGFNDHLVLAQLLAQSQKCLRVRGAQPVYRQ